MKKTALISALILVLSLVLFSACSGKNDTAYTDGTETASANVLAAEKEAPKVNDSIFDSLGSTYKELSERYGNVTKIYNGDGGLKYAFENVSGYFGWAYEQLDYGRTLEEGEGFPKPETDGEGNIIVDKAPRPQSDAVCRIVFEIPISSAFENMPKSSTPEDFAGLYGLELKNTSRGEDTDGRSVSFNYKEKYLICVTVNEDRSIDADSVITYIKPLSLDK